MESLQILVQIGQITTPVIAFLGLLAGIIYFIKERKGSDTKNIDKIPVIEKNCFLTHKGVDERFKRDDERMDKIDNRFDFITKEYLMPMRDNIVTLMAEIKK